jgi:N-acetyltransferase
VPVATFQPPLRLVGRHVELVSLDESHLPALVPGLQDATTVQYLRDPPAPTVESASAWIRRRVEFGREGSAVPLTTILRTSGRPIGMTSFLRLDRPSRGVEIGGTWVARPYWRTPVNTEAKRLMLEYAFETAGMHRVQLQTDLRNGRSQRAIEGLGAVREAELREDVWLPDGTYRTSVYYSILEAEWPRVRDHLDARLARPWAPAALSSDTPGDVGAAARASDRTEVPTSPIGFRPPLTLKGRHVTLEPLERAQLPELIAAGSDPEIWTLLRIRHGDTPEGMAGLVEDLLRLQAAEEVLPFAVRLTDSRRIVGITRYLDIDRANRWVEVGTWLHPSVWRSPVNTELKYLLFRHAFDTEQVHRVQLKTDRRNTRSQRAIERLGAAFEGERRDHYRFPNGTYRTSRYYSILAAEWPSVRARLEEYLRRSWPVPTTAST